MVDGVVKGLIDIYDDEPNDFAQYLDFLQTVGQLLAGALDKARLLDVSRTATATCASWSTPDSSSVPRSSSTRCCARWRPACAAWPTPTSARSSASRGPTSWCASASAATAFAKSGVGQRRPLDEQRGRRAGHAHPPAGGRARCRGDDDLTPQERALLTAAHHRASIHLPLVVRGEVVGLVALFDREPREFVRLPLLQGLAQVAAQAMANATLYRALDESRRRLALISEASLQLASTLELPDVLRATADRLCEVGMAPSCDLHLVSGARPRLRRQRERG